MLTCSCDAADIKEFLPTDVVQDWMESIGFIAMDVPPREDAIRSYHWDHQQHGLNYPNNHNSQWNACEKGFIEFGPDDDEGEPTVPSFKAHRDPDRYRIFHLPSRKVTDLLGCSIIDYHHEPCRVYMVCKGARFCLHLLQMSSFVRGPGDV